MNDLVKSIAVPVTRKRAGKAVRDAAPRPAAVTPASPDSSAGALVGPMRRRVGTVMAAPRHRYTIGDRVRMNAGGRAMARSEATCKVMALLPHEGGPLLYRVRSEVESYERVVQEADLELIR